VNDLERRRTWWLLPLIGALLLALPATGGGDDDDDDDGDPFVPNQLILELEEEDEGAVDLDAIIADHPEIVSLIASIDEEEMHLVQLDLPPGMTAQDFAEMLEEDDERIDDAELNHATDAPEGSTQDFYVQVFEGAFNEQYTFGHINLPEAHSVSRGEGVTVALLDTGLDVDHPELAGVTILPGHNFIDGNDDVSEPETGVLAGHGTFMTGLVTAVAPDAAILPIRVLDGDGQGNAFVVAAGIYHAVAEGADIINLSLATQDANTILSQAVEEATDEGVTVVAAAGNSNAPIALFPAAHTGVIAVASTDEGDLKSEFSSYGEHVSISAPGTEVVSTIPGGHYARWNGTSLSTAIVSGSAALVIALDPGASPVEVQNELCGASVDLDDANPDFTGQLGCGRLDVAGAVGIDPDFVIGDLDADGMVGVPDLVIMFGAWDATGSPADLDQDGVVGVGDLVILITNWG
jgi:subtilisin family serine protease